MGYFIEMVTHPDINPTQQGLTSVNRREPEFPFGDSHTDCPLDVLSIRRLTVVGVKGASLLCLFMCVEMG